MVTPQKWSSALKLSDKIPANSKALRTLFHQLSALFRTKKKPGKLVGPDANLEAPIDQDAFSEEIKDEKVGAEEMQVLERLFDSRITSETSNTPSSSSHHPISNTKPMNLEKQTDYSFCKICLERKEYGEMFINDACSHSFCNECTTNHIVVKIQDRVEKIPCPSLNCKAILLPEAWRHMIPIDALVKSDELRCMSLIESQKLYCPFRDCLAILVKDSGKVTTFGQCVRCVVCKRWFCEDCLVPWHSEFSCVEFKKLYSKKGGKDEKLVESLAKKKSWKKCPKCKMYVEKSDGCVRITCRCKYEFCYRCGGKWFDSHYRNCLPPKS